MKRKNTDKVAEMQIITWFLEADWEIYTPIKDQWKGDIIVREPHIPSITSRRFDSIQIKHKQDDNGDFGWLLNHWIVTDPLFDCMIVLLPCQQRGLMLRRVLFPKLPLRFLEFDVRGFATGEFTAFYKPHSFSLSHRPECERFELFIERYQTIMN